MRRSSQSYFPRKAIVLLKNHRNVHRLMFLMNFPPPSTSCFFSITPSVFITGVRCNFCPADPSDLYARDFHIRNDII